jgi:hypothetical protein
MQTIVEVQVNSRMVFRLSPAAANVMRRLGGTMSKLYFHLTIGDEYFPDPIGKEMKDLATAHSHAVLLARRAMSLCEPECVDARVKRWVVAIENERGRKLMSVIVPSEMIATDVQRRALSDGLIVYEDADAIYFSGPPLRSEVRRPEAGGN